MNDKPSFLVAVAGLDPQQVRLIEIVFRHIQYNRFVFRLAGMHEHAFADIVIAGLGHPDGRELLARTRSERPEVPAIAATDGPGEGASRHAIEIGQLTRQLLPILNRVVEIEGLAGAIGPAAAAAPGGGSAASMRRGPDRVDDGGTPVANGRETPVADGRETGIADGGETSIADGCSDAAHAAGTLSAGGGARSPGRVLVVEDSSVVRAHLAAEFERMGLSVEIAGSGADALARLWAVPVQLVMLDLGLPDVDGLQVARRIRAEPRWRELPIVVLTSRVSALDVVRGAAAGCSAYLAKPVDSATLRRVVERQLGGAPGGRLSGESRAAAPVVSG